MAAAIIVFLDTLFCKQAPAPARGWEYKSGLTLFGLPFLHISFKYRRGGRPIVARGIIAIGQFATGFLAIGQFAVGAIALGQFTAGIFAAGQFVFGYSAWGMLGLYVHDGHVHNGLNLLHWFTHSS